MYKLSRVCLQRSAVSAAAAVSALALALPGAMQAQEVASLDAPPAVGTATGQAAAQPTLDLDLHTALHGSTQDDAQGVSSSSSATADGAPGNGLLALEAAPSSAITPDGSLQPPPYRRRRYGAPSYSDRMHNADGSSKLALVAGGGFNIPTGSASSDYLKTDWRFEGGVGYNFSRKFGVMLQFDWDNFGLPGAVLANQQALYSALDPSDAANGAFQGLDGHTHIWSFTVNPTFNFYQSETVGAYAVVGTGFYHKVTDFTLPETGEYCDPYYGCYEYEANQNFDDYTSNAIGATGGIGITYKFSRFANQKFFAEARFVHTFNQARAADPSAAGTSSGTPYNFYPPNSNETSYIPITFGIRF